MTLAFALVNNMQARRRNAKFTIMAVGVAGAGKSVLFNNLVGRQVVANRHQKEIDVYMLNLDGIGIRQNIVFIDTPGFGTGLNDESLQESLVDYIREQFDLYIEEESKIRRNPQYDDTRVHCLLYIVPATGARLRQSDVSFLRKVSGYVNIIPIISKADALSELEKAEMQKQINEQLQFYSISTFNFANPEHMPCADGLCLNAAQPLCTICTSNPEGTTWHKNHAAGTIELDSKAYSDLSVLRELLFGGFMEVLIDTTVSDIYETYRTKILESAIGQHD